MEMVQNVNFLLIATVPTFACAKQKIVNLSTFAVCNSLLSALSENHASFFAALLEINYFCLLSIISSFLPLSLINGYGLNFVHTLCAQTILLIGLLTFEIFPTPMHNA